MKLYLFICLAATVLLSTSCATLEPLPISTVPPTVAPPTQMAEPAKPKDPNVEFAKLVARALDVHGKALLDVVPADVEAYCPNYAKRSWSERKAAWIMLVSALVKFESNFKNESSYKENFKDAKGQYVISRGLLQISQESANGYGCGIKDANQLHDPTTNINCGVKIMNKWVSQDKVVASSASPWKGLARYWSPFRSAEKKKAIQAKVKEVCR